jgi:hypothetical protein
VNNYFAGLRGDQARSAISMMSGIPGSPLNGYFQVKDAVVAFNTLVDNSSSIAIGVGAGNRNTLPPQDCLIANNIVTSRQAPLIHQFANPIRLTWEGNLMSGADLGIPTPSGVTVADPKLVLGEGGLMRPDSASPALGASVGDFPFVREDIDGQARSGKLDVGCDQRSDQPIVYRPLTPAEVGPPWRRGTASGTAR